MKTSVDISASLICIDWLHLQDQLKILTAHGINRLHIDMMDGRLARDFGISLPILRQVRTVFNGTFDYHVMCEEAQSMYSLFPKKAGDSICFHLTNAENGLRQITEIKKQGFLAGLSVESKTSLDEYSSLLPYLDLLTVVAVPPGSIGAPGDPLSIKVIQSLSDWRHRHQQSFKLVADGNVTPAKAIRLVGSGADVLVGGSTGLFRKNLSLDLSILELKNAIKKGQSTCLRSSNFANDHLAEVSAL